MAGFRRPRNTISFAIRPHTTTRVYMYIYIRSRGLGRRECGTLHPDCTTAAGRRWKAEDNADDGFRVQRYLDPALRPTSDDRYVRTPGTIGLARARPSARPPAGTIRSCRHTRARLCPWNNTKAPPTIVVICIIFFLLQHGRPYKNEKPGTTNNGQ